MLFLCLILWLGPCTADTEMLADRDELEGKQKKGVSIELTASAAPLCVPKMSCV